MSELSFFELVGNVRAMRRLKPDAVPEDLLRKVLDAGAKAPSGQNTQPWSFLVLKKEDSKRWFADRYRAAMEQRFGSFLSPSNHDDKNFQRQLDATRYQIDHMHRAPVLLVVCGVRDWPFSVPEGQRVGHAPPSYGAVYPCVQNILLACRAVGLGASLTTMQQVFEQEMHERFGIPDDYGVVATIPIGFPMGKFGPTKRNPAADVTYFERWHSTDFE